MEGSERLMPNNIDEKIVSLELENKGFEKAASVTINTIEKLKKALAFEKSTDGIDSLSKSLNKVDFSSIQNGVESLSKSFSTFGIASQTVISDVVHFAESKLSGLWDNTIGQIMTGGKARALNIANAQFKLEGLGIDWEQASKDINAAVSGTAYGFDEAANAASNLSASGIQLGEGAGQMAESLKAISGLAAMTNSSFSDIANIMSDVAGMGKLTANETNRLAVRGLNVVAEMAKQLGTSQEAIRESMKKGEIDFYTFSHAMFEAYSEQAFKANETFEGSFANVKAALSRIGALFYTPYLDSMIGVFNSLREVINAVNKAITPVMETFGETMHILSSIVSLRLSNWVENFKGNLNPLNETLKIINERLEKYKQFLEGSFVKGNKEAIDSSNDTAKNISADLSKITDAEKQAARDIWTTGKYGAGDERRRQLEAEGMSYERVQKYLEEYIITGKETKETEEKINEVIKDKIDILDTSSEYYERVGYAIRNVINMFHNMQRIITQLGGIIRNVAEIFLRSFLEVFNYEGFTSHYNGLLVTIEYYLELANQLTKNSSTIKAIADTVFTLLNLYFETKWFLTRVLVDFIANIFKALKGTNTKPIDETVKTIDEKIVDTGQAVVSFVEIAREKITEFANKLVPLVAGGIKFIINLIKLASQLIKGIFSLFNFSGVSGIFTFIGKVITNIIDFAQILFKVISKLIKAFSNFIGVVIDFINSIFGKIDLTFFKKLITSVLNAISNLINGISILIGKFRTFLSTVQDNPALEKFRQFLLNIFSNIGDFLKNIAIKFIEFFDKLGNIDFSKLTFKSFIDNIKDVIKSLPVVTGLIDDVDTVTRRYPDEKKNIFSFLVEIVGKLFDVIKNVVVNKAKVITETVKTVITSVINGVKQALSKVNIFDIIGTGLLVGLIFIAGLIIKTVIRIVNLISTAFSLLENSIYSMSNMAKGYITTRGSHNSWLAMSQAIIESVATIGEIVAAIILLSDIKTDKLIIIFTGLGVLMYLFTKLMVAVKPVKNITIIVLYFAAMLAAVGYIISQVNALIEVLKDVDNSKLKQVIIVLGVIAGFVVLFAITMTIIAKVIGESFETQQSMLKEGSNKSSVKKTNKLFTQFAILFAAVGIMIYAIAAALKKVSKIDTEKMLPATMSLLVSTLAIAAGLGMFIKKLSMFTNLTVTIGSVVGSIVALAGILVVLKVTGVLDKVTDATTSLIKTIAVIIRTIVYGFLDFWKEMSNGSKVWEIVGIIASILLIIGIIAAAIKQFGGIGGIMNLFRSGSTDDNSSGNNEKKENKFFKNFFKNLLMFTGALFLLIQTLKALPDAAESLIRFGDILQVNGDKLAVILGVIFTAMINAGIMSLTKGKTKLAFAIIGVLLSLAVVLAKFLDSDGLQTMELVIFDFLVKVADVLVAIVRPVVMFIVYLLVEIITTLAEVVGEMGGGLAEAIGLLIDALLYVLEIIFFELLKGLNDIIPLMDAWDSVLGWLSNASQAVSDYLWDNSVISDGFGEKLSDFFDGASSGLEEYKEIYESGIDMLNSNEFIEKSGQELAERAREFRGNSKEWASSWFEAKDDIEKATENLPETISKAATKFTNASTEIDESSNKLNNSTGNFLQSVANVVKSTDLLNQVDKNGKSSSFLQSLSFDMSSAFGEGVEGFDFSALGNNMSTALSEGVEGFDFSALGNNMSTAFGEGAGNFDFQAFGNTMGEATGEGWAEVDFENYGGLFNEGISEGIDETEDKVNDTLDRSVDAMETVLQTELEPAGQEAALYLIEGLRKGIDDNESIVFKRIRALTKDIVDRLNAGLEIDSPSKLTAESGKWFDLGFIKGVEKFQNGVTDSVGELSNNVIKSFGNPVSAIQSVINDDIEVDPSIRPVIDLDGVYYGVNQMNGLLSPQSAMLARFGGAHMTANTEIDTKYNDRNVINSINELKTEISSLKNSINETQVILDSGALVGSLASPMDKALGRRKIYAGRRN